MYLYEFVSNRNKRDFLELHPFGWLDLSATECAALKFQFGGEMGN